MKRIFVLMLCVMSAVALSARSASITISKRVWELGERIEVKASGLNSSLKYRVSAFPRRTTNNNDPIKTRSFKNKTSVSVFMRLREDQGVKPGKYEFHLYRPDSNSIISKVNFVLEGGGTNPPVDPPVDPPVTGSGNFTASSGTTDLNYADTTTFISEYAKLGFKNTKYQKTVTKSQLTSLLANKNNMHFHSGHGGSDGSINCTDGNLYAKNLSGKIQSTYSIYCICSSFASSNWSRVMGSNAKMVMGFNKTVTDGSCLSLASKFPAQLKSGQSYLMAWYKSNSAISGHKDRWATYVKEGSKVVLYKAGGNIPRYQFEGNPINLTDVVTVDDELLYNWIYESFGRSKGPFIIKKAPMHINKTCKWPTKKSNTSTEKAINKAFTVLGDNLPDSAVLDTVIPIEKCDTKNKCFTVAQGVYFAQEYNGIKIRSNSVADYILVLVGKNKIGITAEWSEIDDSAEASLNVTLSVAQALSIASENISNIIREPVVIAEYKVVYGISTDDDGSKILVPAYEFIGENGESFVVSAFTGKLVQ